MTITIYSTSTCVACHSLTKWLDELGQPYAKRITDEDDAALTDFMAVNDGLIGVPFSVVTADDGHITKIPGYDQRKFREALGLT